MHARRSWTHLLTSDQSGANPAKELQQYSSITVIVVDARGSNPAVSLLFLQELFQMRARIRTVLLRSKRAIARPQTQLWPHPALRCLRRRTYKQLAWCYSDSSQIELIYRVHVHRLFSTLLFFLLDIATNASSTPPPAVANKTTYILLY